MDFVNLHHSAAPYELIYINVTHIVRFEEDPGLGTTVYLSTNELVHAKENLKQITELIGRSGGKLTYAE